MSRPQKWSQNEDCPGGCTLRISRVGIPEITSPITGKSLEWLGLYILPGRHSICPRLTATFGPELRNNPVTMTLEKPITAPFYSSASVPMAGQLATWTHARTPIVACSGFEGTLAGSSLDGFRFPPNLSLPSSKTIPAVCKLVETPRINQRRHRFARKIASFTPNSHR